MSVVFDSEIAAAPCGSRSSARASTAQPIPADVTTTEHYATADNRLAIGYRQPRPARTDDARPNTRAGLDRAEGERPAARQSRASPGRRSVVDGTVGPQDPLFVGDVYE